MTRSCATSIEPTVGRRTLLVGTAEGVRQLRQMIAETAEPITPIGALTPTAGGPPASHEDPIPARGTTDDLERIVAAEAVELMLLCLPGPMHTLAAELEQRAAAVGVVTRRVPTFTDLLRGEGPMASGVVDVAKLLDREPHPLDEQAIKRVLAGRRVLITGAGGSIGSELARIVARFAPDSLLLMDRSENALFEIDRVIAQQHPQLRRRALLHDVTDESRTLALLRELKPHVVFHAAAHKHVPMMEDHPAAAIENNFFGTRSVADAAVACGAERFVMISTDKAVNPSSVMGATKRTAELYVQHLAGRSKTRLAMVRFGNVLGSACSVVPIWSQQLAAGGPLTVTDRRMTRFFMTIGEAAALVIQAATLREGGSPIFVLDMNEPIRIVDMAERFIRLHGLEPGRDVRIVFTGTRPGEKLHEQLAYDSEDVLPTAHPAVRLLRTARPADAHVRWMLHAFKSLRHSEERAPVLRALRRAVPEMTGSNAAPTQQPAASATVVRAAG